MSDKLRSTVEKELQDKKGTAYPTEILATNGEMQKIEFHDADKNFIIEAIWDSRDTHTTENYDAFRKWAYNIMRDKGYKVVLSEPKLVVIK